MIGKAIGKKNSTNIHFAFTNTLAAFFGKGL